MIVAGVDVGNATTEVAIARLSPGREPEFLSITRGPTTGAKGSAAAADGVLDLIARASRRLGEEPARILLADLHPVETGLRELAADEERDLGGVAIARPVSATPSGLGAAAGRLVDLDDLAGEPAGEPVIPIVPPLDFDEASARLNDARARGWRITAIVVANDDGVLIGNRVDRTLPIIDEVADAADLPRGAWAAIEVAAPGGAVEQLADPLRLAVLLALDPARARGARNAARGLVGHRAAIAVRGEASSGDSHRDAPPFATLRDGSQVPVDHAVAPPALPQEAAQPRQTSPALSLPFLPSLPLPQLPFLPKKQPPLPPKSQLPPRYAVRGWPWSLALADGLEGAASRLREAEKGKRRVVA